MRSHSMSYPRHPEKRSPFPGGGKGEAAGHEAPPLERRNTLASSGIRRKHRDPNRTPPVSSELIAARRKVLAFPARTHPTVGSPCDGICVSTLRQRRKSYRCPAP